MAEIESTYRVYVLTQVWSSTAETEEEAQERASALLSRFRPEDVSVEQWEWYGGSLGRWIVKTRRWVPRGEWKGMAQARANREAIDSALQPTVVARNSVAEHDLLKYGTVPLKEAVSDGR